MQQIWNVFGKRAQSRSQYSSLPGSRFSIRSGLVTAVLVCGLQAQMSADPVPVRHFQGTVHGFLVQRGEDGKIIATGDSVQVSRGNQVTSRTTFTYKDGSVDDDTTVFTQQRVFKLISDHHIQKGPFFPHPMDLMIDTRTGQVTYKTTGKDGKQDVHTQHMNLPEDLANGMVSQVIANLRAGAPLATVSILVTAPKPRIVKLQISPVGEDNFAVGGASRKASHYEIKIELGGVAGVVAPLVGKAPPNIQFWQIGGEAPTFLREKGPTFQDGPMITIEQMSPEWPDTPKSNT
jgi:hypothetical protein